MMAIRTRTGPGALAIAVAIVLGASLASGPALASHSQIAIMQDDIALMSNPGPTLQEMRHLGVQMVRVTVRWSYIAPAPTSHRRPNFNATDPNAYPRRNWAPYDALVQDAHADGIKVMFVVTASAPFWAQSPGAGHYLAQYTVDRAFEPSAAAYGQFFRAVAARYSGSFTPPRAATPLPRVSAWELYNEPNFGEDLAPQAIYHSQVLWAPVMLRPLLNAAWGALRATGHAQDTTLIGALAARGGRIITRRGYGLPGTYGETTPLEFIRDLYCLDSRYRPYRGYNAAVRRCPTTAGASRRFRAQNPALFSASAWSVHPYQLDGDSNVTPDTTRYNNPNYVSLSQVPNMARALDHIQRVYGSGKRFPIWDDEYGYITDPPVFGAPAKNCRCHYVSATNAAAFINWAEYLSWQNPRIASTMQYLLYDPNPTVATPMYGGFASGLIYYRSILRGQPKLSYFAYRMPIFMPRTSTSVGNALLVWGDVRPAPLAVADGDGPQYAQIQFAQPGGQWVTEKTVQVTDPHGYFQTWVVLPASGKVRISWSYSPTDLNLASDLVTPTPSAGPDGASPTPITVSSRSVAVSVGGMRRSRRGARHTGRRRAGKPHPAPARASRALGIRPRL